VVLLIALEGCAPVISKPLRNQADETIGVTAVVQAPQTYEGQIVIWGGEIVNAVNLPAATRLEVLQKPLDYQMRPKSVDVSEGRFLVLYEGFLDVAIYSQGREVTVGGELTGVEILPLGQTRYTYPTVKVREIHLWPQRPEVPGDYYRYPYYYPYYYPYRHRRFYPGWPYYPYWR
jgi:outer membrane lipoprotein